MTTKNSISCPDVIFVLYGGSSCDGNGPGTYEGYTDNPTYAYKHFMKCKEDPYSTGRVVALTNKTKEVLIWQNDWDEYL